MALMGEREEENEERMNNVETCEKEALLIQPQQRVVCQTALWKRGTTTPVWGARKKKQVPYFLYVGRKRTAIVGRKLRQTWGGGPRTRGRIVKVVRKSLQQRARGKRKIICFLSELP